MRPVGRKEAPAHYPAAQGRLGRREKGGERKRGWCRQGVDFPPMLQPVMILPGFSGFQVVDFTFERLEYP